MQVDVEHVFSTYDGDDFEFTCPICNTLIVTQQPEQLLTCDCGQDWKIYIKAITYPNSEERNNGKIYSSRN